MKYKSNAVRANLILFLLILLELVPLLVNSKGIPARNHQINNKNASEQKSMNKIRETFMGTSQTNHQDKVYNIQDSSLFLRD
jgi:hypothetical protein